MALSAPCWMASVASLAAPGPKTTAVAFSPRPSASLRARASASKDTLAILPSCCSTNTQTPVILDHLLFNQLINQLARGFFGCCPFDNLDAADARGEGAHFGP